MNDNKQRKSLVGPLLIILVILLIVALMLESSPLYYKNIINTVYQLSKNGISYGEKNKSAKFDVANQFKIEEVKNKEIRKALENGGSIEFNYNYVPSERSWDTMYTYSLSRYSAHGDCTFYCTRNSYQYGLSDLCTCLYSEKIWDELVSLILDKEELVDTNSVYDSNGKVVDRKIWKTVSLESGVYAPSNIDDIEAYFKKLAINAGAKEEDLNLNIPVYDDMVSNREDVVLNGDFVYDPVGEISEKEKGQLEQYIREKYNETGVRMYILLLDSYDKNYLIGLAEEMLAKATSPGIVLEIAPRNYLVRLKMKKDHESALRENRDEVFEAYHKSKNKYKGLIKAIDKAYELY